MNDFGKKLKDLREKKGIKTQTELANRLGLSPNTIAKYESGNRFPEPDILIKIADIFCVTIDYLIGREKELSFNKEREACDYIISLINDSTMGKREFSEYISEKATEIDGIYKGVLPELRILKKIANFFKIPYKELAKNHPKYTEDTELVDFLLSGNYSEYIKLAKWISDVGLKPETVKNLIESLKEDLR